MHSVMNSGPFTYQLATFTVFEARGSWVSPVGGSGTLAYARNVGYRMYVRVFVAEGGESPWRLSTI